MDKATRIEMLRLSFRANGGIPFAFKGIRKAKAYQGRNGSKWDEWPQVEVNNKRTPKWVFKVAAAPLVIAPKRVARLSPLTKIAEQLPYKLPSVSL